MNRFSKISSFFEQAISATEFNNISIYLLDRTN